MNPPPLHLLPSGPQVSLRGRGAAPPCPDPGVQAPSALATTLPTPSTPLSLLGSACPSRNGPPGLWHQEPTQPGGFPSPLVARGHRHACVLAGTAPARLALLAPFLRDREAGTLAHVRGAPGHAGPWRSRGAQGGAGRRETEENGKDGLRGMGGGGPTGVCEPQARGGHQQTPNKS